MRARILIATLSLVLAAAACVDGGDPIAPEECGEPRTDTVAVGETLSVCGGDTAVIVITLPGMTEP